jgi:hypothetical protein
LDLTADERVVLDAVALPINHPYRDQPPEGISVRCYPYAEVFAEKIRALGDRARPRDLYDVINLHRREDALEAAANVREVLVQKCEFKSIPVPTLAALAPSRDELSADWDHMLAHQLPHLPPFESFWDALPSFFTWLERGVRPAQLAPYELAAGEQVIRPAIGTLSVLGVPRTSPFERIRFAAASRLCVDLDYSSLDGRRSRRLIEPYSLRRTRDGNVVLHALRADGGGHRSYRVEWIHGASVTSQTFTPKYAIELSPESPLSAPRTSPRAALRSVSRRPRAARALVGYEPQYIYECPLCRRTFRRRRADPRLRAHDDQNGRPCFGRSGLYRSGP